MCLSNHGCSQEASYFVFRDILIVNVNKQVQIDNV